MTIYFEWDEEKAETNLRKHGVDFSRAARIFEGVFIESVDDREHYGELRMRAIGECEGNVYIVIYTPRNDALRIISAWKAGKNDREKYYQTITE